MKKHRKPIFTAAFVLSAAALAALLVFLGPLDLFEKKLLDFRFRYFNRDLPVSEDVVYIDIDEESLQTLSPQIGGWPWPRGSVMGRYVIDYVMKGEPAILLFDLLYVEYSAKTPDVKIPEEDLMLLDYSMMYPQVSHAALFEAKSEGVRKELPDTAAGNFQVPVETADARVLFPSYGSYVVPFEPLDLYAGSIHLVNHLEDSDGISRNYNLMYRYGDGYYPSLALAALRAKLGIGKLRVEGRDLVLSAAGGAEMRVPLLRDGEMQLDFYRDLDEFRMIPVDNVIASAMNLEAGDPDLAVPYADFKGKIVVIGASATGLKDLKVTPMGRNFAGPLLHITALSNILQGQFLRPVPPVLSLLVIACSAALVVLMTLYVRNGIVKNVSGIVYVVLLGVLSVVLFRRLGVVVQMANTLVTVLIAYFGALIFLSLTEGAEKNKISAAMGKYLAPAVMKEVLEHRERLIGEVGEKKELSILFSDIRGFTTLAEGLTAEAVVSMLNTYLDAMIDVVFQYKGTLDKLIGDAIMTFWGAPTAEDRKEYLAVKTGLSMIEKLEQVNAVLAERRMPALSIGVGVNTGDMIVGNIGSEKRLDYTVIGDNVNLGSRLEGLTKHYHIPLIASHSTYERTKDDFLWVPVDTVAVKGKETGVRIHTALTEKGEGEKACIEEAARFEEAYSSYRERRFQEAAVRFSACARDLSRLGSLAAVLAERCGRLQAEPPEPGWDGTWKMLDK